MNSHIEEPGLAELAARLDRLGAAERGGAAEDFEARLLTVVRGGAREDGPALRYVPAAAPAERAGSGRRWSALPLAAAVAMTATIGAVWLSGRGVQPESSRIELAALTLEQDVSQWLSLSEVVGQELDAELAAIDAEAARLSGKADEANSGLESLIEEGSL